MPSGALASHWRETPQSLASSEQTAFSFDAARKREDDQTQLRALFGAMVRKAGGTDWLCAALDHEPSYEKRIYDAVNGAPERKVQLEWLAPMLDDDGAVAILLGWLSERCKYEPPVRQKRDVPIEDINAAAREVLAEIKDEEQRDMMRKRIAKKLGVRVEDVRL